MSVRIYPTTPSRRRVLAAGTGLLLAHAVAGCDALSTAPDSDEGKTRRAEADSKEAPALADQVKAGDLPPLEKRLPEEPLVIEPHESTGVYGGTWRSALQGSADTSWCWYTIGYEPPMRWNVEWTEVIPNVAGEVEILNDGATYVMHLRKGMRWSDGEPFTSADILFAYNDVLGNESLDSAIPGGFTTNGVPAEFEAVDEYTVRITFESPNGLFVQRLASGEGMNLCMYPKHYLEEFHGDYNETVDELVEAAGVSGWPELFASKTSLSGIWAVEYWQNPDIPTICAWHITQPPGAGSRVVAERNPYYWKTDPDGRQLPYLDKVQYEVLENPETILLKASNGEFDMYARHINDPLNKPVLAAERETAEFDFFDLQTANMNHMIIAFNLTHDDPQLREVFRSKDFRIGLSYAINREELIDAVHHTIGEPWQPAPYENSGLYDEQLAKQYTEFDLDKANEHLDAAGLSQRDSDGNRLRPDGQPVVVSVAVNSENTGWLDALNLVKGYWAEVGVELRTQSMERSLFEERTAGNQVEASVWGGDGGMRDAFMDPRWYFPFSDRSYFAVKWAEWYTTNGDSGEEPPAPAKKQQELYEAVKATPDADEQFDLMQEILAIAAEEFYAIGTALPGPGFGIVKNNFHNLPSEFPDSSIYNTPGPTKPEQYYIEDN